jgi:hypothetical protein
MRRLLLLSIFTLPMLFTPLRAGVLAGHTVNLVYYFPNPSSPVDSPPNQTAAATFVGVVGGDFDLHVNDTTVIADNFFVATFFNSTTFNGWVLTDLSGSPITGVTVDGATTMPGFSASNLSFTANSITVNWQGLSFDPTTVVQLDINGGGAAAPEPATFALIGLGVAGIAFARRRRTS